MGKAYGVPPSHWFSLPLDDWLIDSAAYTAGIEREDEARASMTDQVDRMANRFKSRF